jgi:hypothetical protein
MLQVKENNRDDLVVVLAGYAGKMDRFDRSNSGFRSRVAHYIDFPDYTDADLIAAGEKMLASLNYGSPKATERRSPNILRSGERTALCQRAFDPECARQDTLASSQWAVRRARSGMDA